VQNPFRVSNSERVKGEEKKPPVPQRGKTTYKIGGKAEGKKRLGQPDRAECE
jgi:hypothetical protein